MKKFNKQIFVILSALSLLLLNSCNPFDDVYLKLSMDTEFNTFGAGNQIFTESSLCLSDFDDYEDNKDKLEEIRYVSSAFFTINATNGLSADTLKIKLIRSDINSALFEFVLPNFAAATYKNSPLKITLTAQEINNLNQYLTNPKVDKCFRAELRASNVQYTGITFSLQGRVEFLTELKIKP